MIYQIASTVPHGCDIIMYTTYTYIHKTPRDRGLSASLIHEACVRWRKCCSNRWIRNPRSEIKASCAKKSEVCASDNR